MGPSLERLFFLYAISRNGPQRIGSSINELLKLFERSSEGGPCYLNQLEEITRIASGGLVSGTHTTSIYNFPTRKANALLFPRRNIILDRKQTSLLHNASSKGPSKSRIDRDTSCSFFVLANYQRNQARPPHGRGHIGPLVQKATTLFTGALIPAPRYTRGRIGPPSIHDLQHLFNISCYLRPTLCDPYHAPCSRQREGYGKTKIADVGVPLGGLEAVLHLTHAREIEAPLHDDHAQFRRDQPTEGFHNSFR